VKVDPLLGKFATMAANAPCFGLGKPKPLVKPSGDKLVLASEADR
jgi:hypothetical protein